jgi:hypothetical protein
MHNATGTYRLTAESQECFGGKLLHLIDRSGNVIGKVGRNGYLEGTLEGKHLRATLRCASTQASIDLVFADAFQAFEGTCSRDQHTHRCMGARVGHSHAKSEAESGVR